MSNIIMEPVQGGYQILCCSYCKQDVVARMVLLQNGTGDRIIRTDCPVCRWPINRFISSKKYNEWEKCGEYSDAKNDAWAEGQWDKYVTRSGSEKYGLQNLPRRSKSY